MTCGRDGPGGKELGGGCGYEFCWVCGGPYHTTSCSRPKEKGEFGSFIHFERFNQKINKLDEKIESLIESQQKGRAKFARKWKDPLALFFSQDTSFLSHVDSLRASMTDLEISASLALCACCVFLASNKADALESVYTSLDTALTDMNTLKDEVREEDGSQDWMERALYSLANTKELYKDLVRRTQLLAYIPPAYELPPSVLQGSPLFPSVIKMRVRREGEEEEEEKKEGEFK